LEITMSKLMQLLRGNTPQTEDALRQSTSLTMAYLLERNRRFEHFLLQKLTELESRVAAQGARFDGEGAARDEPEVEAGEAWDTAPDEGVMAEAETPLVSLVEGRLFGAPEATIQVEDSEWDVEDYDTSAGMPDEAAPSLQGAFNLAAEVDAAVESELETPDRDVVEKAGPEAVETRTQPAWLEVFDDGQVDDAWEGDELNSGQVEDWT
jgi:hypothetical protein